MILSGPLCRLLPSAWTGKNTSNSPEVVVAGPSMMRATRLDPAEPDCIISSSFFFFSSLFFSSSFYFSTTSSISSTTFCSRDGEEGRPSTWLKEGMLSSLLTIVIFRLCAESRILYNWGAASCVTGISRGIGSFLILIHCLCWCWSSTMSSSCMRSLEQSCPPPSWPLFRRRPSMTARPTAVWCTSRMTWLDVVRPGLPTWPNRPWLKVGGMPAMLVASSLTRTGGMSQSVDSLYACLFHASTFERDCRLGILPLQGARSELWSHPTECYYWEPNSMQLVYGDCLHYFVKFVLL